MLYIIICRKEYKLMKEFTALFSRRCITIIGIQFLLFAHASSGLKYPPRKLQKAGCWVLWELATRGRIKKKDLRRCTRQRLSELDSIHEELEKDGRIRIDANMISSK